MPSLPDQFASSFTEYWAIVAGSLIVATYAKRRFNEPTFPSCKALPQAVEPLRYLFLKPQYRRARWAYVVLTLMLYVLIVLPGPVIINIVGIDQKTFPPQAWSLLIALVLVGLLPNSSNFKWIFDLEQELRRFVHEHYLVPRRVEETITLLQDVSFQPPASYIASLPGTLSAKIYDGLKAPANSLAHRWARVTMLMELQSQMGPGASLPLRKAAFEPFQKDFDVIRERYEALKKDIAPLLDQVVAGEADKNTARLVDDLLDRLYSYLSWGIRHQANTEHEVDETLLALGFDVPPGGDVSLFNIVFPAIVSVGFIVAIFSVLIDTIMAGDKFEVRDSVFGAVTFSIAAAAMYGGAIYFALDSRKDQIRKRTWCQSSPKCLFRIAVKAGFATWAVIVAVTVLGSFADTVHSLAGLWWAGKSLASGAGGLAPVEWCFLPLRIVTALPWFMAGAVVSLFIAYRVGGDVQESRKRNQVRDALVLGFLLGLTAALATLIQISVGERLKGLGIATADDLKIPLLGTSEILRLSLSSGLAGSVCGAIIGFAVPAAHKANLLRPEGRIERRRLRDLLGQAERVLGTRVAAENWMFTPKEELDGITPSEAIHYKELATGVSRLLDSVAPRGCEDVQPDRSNRPIPIVIEGGLPQTWGERQTEAHHIGSERGETVAV